MLDNATLSYWLLWLANQWWFWVLFLLGLTVLALWPIIINRIEEKAFRMNNFKPKYIEHKMFSGR